jgi:hypothetical protein
MAPFGLRRPLRLAKGVAASRCQGSCRLNGRFRSGTRHHKSHVEQVLEWHPQRGEDHRDGRAAGLDLAVEQVGQCSAVHAEVGGDGGVGVDAQTVAADAAERFGSDRKCRLGGPVFGSHATILHDSWLASYETVPVWCDWISNQARYVGPVSQPHPEFGSWLAARITEAGYRSPSGFATAADLQPSMVLRWINGKVQPTPEALVKAAKALRVRVSEMLARGLNIPELEETHELHPLAVRVNRLLTDHDLVPEDERRMLETMLDRFLTPPERTYYRIASVAWGPGVTEARDEVSRYGKALTEEARRLEEGQRSEAHHER